MRLVRLGRAPIGEVPLRYTRHPTPDTRHPTPRSAIISVAPPKPVDAYHALKRAHVVCSLREGAIRLAPHCYNTVEEMEKVVEVLDSVA